MNTNIVDTKAAFLRTQTRLLSSPLQPSPTWQTLTTGKPVSSQSDITLAFPEKALTDVLTKVNAKIKSHNRLVFSLPSQRHVAEQLDALYWNEVTSELLSDVQDLAWIPLDADLTDSSVIKGLPDALAGRDDETATSSYVELKTRAAELSRRRDEIEKKVESYRKLRELLEPFADVKGDVQQNLVGRDGELAREMERMKVLVARVMGGLQGWERKDENAHGEPSGEDVQEVRQVLNEQDKLARVMELG